MHIYVFILYHLICVLLYISITIYTFKELFFLHFRNTWINEHESNFTFLLLSIFWRFYWGVCSYIICLILIIYLTWVFCPLHQLLHSQNFQFNSYLYSEYFIEGFVHISFVWFDIAFYFLKAWLFIYLSVCLSVCLAGYLSRKGFFCENKLSDKNNSKIHSVKTINSFFS